MERPTLATLRAIAHAHGFTWADADLEAVLPAVTRALEALAALEDVPVGAIEPATHFRIV